MVPTSWIWTRLTRHLGSKNAKNALRDQTRDSSTQRKMIKYSAGELHTFGGKCEKSQTNFSLENCSLGKSADVTLRLTLLYIYIYSDEKSECQIVWVVRWSQIAGGYSRPIQPSGEIDFGYWTSTSAFCFMFDDMSLGKHVIPYMVHWPQARVWSKTVRLLLRRHVVI